LSFHRLLAGLYHGRAGGQYHRGQQHHGQQSGPAATALVPAPEDQVAAAREVLKLLAYHPYAVAIAASATVALQMSWAELLTALGTTASTRLRTLRLAESDSAILWLPLELDWERLDPAGRYALETLGRLPYFSRYTPALTQAAWRVSAEEAAVLLKELAAPASNLSRKKGGVKFQIGA
jgi:hypothetical protein